MKSRNKEMTAKAVLIALLVSTAASPFQSSMASSKSAAKKISVTLNKKTLSLKTGQRFRLKVKKKPAKAKVSFSSSKRSVVSVNKTGLVKAKKPGKASITATVKYKGKKKKAVCKVRVVSKKKTINKQIQPSAPAEDGNQGKTLEYTYKNVDKKLAFYNLDNGMKLVLTAPVSEIYSEAYGLAKMIILAMIVAFILSAVIGIVMGTGLTKPIRQLTSVIEQTAALDFRPTEAGAKLRKQKDEIGDMATKIHDMRKKLRAMMENLQQTQQVLETNTGNLNQLMKQNSAYAEDNSAATQELAAGMEETSANAAHIVENVGIMRESSDNIQRLAEDGEKNSGQIQERAGEMERISTESRSKTDEMYAVMKQKTDAAVEQAKSVQKINALTDNIKQISSQTNLLALNANIEAARAGEAGRGFAVVASEIGDLATQTLDTVSTIDEIVGEVNSSVSNMTECLTTIMEFLEQTVLGDYEHFAQVGEQYHADADTFQQIMQQTKEAVDALEQHIGEISSTVSEINSMVEQSTDGISGIAEKSGSTQNLVTEGYDKLQECTQSVNVIRDFVAQFHLD